MYYTFRKPSTYILAFFAFFLGNMILMAVFRNLGAPADDTITAIQNRLGFSYIWAINSFFSGLNSSLLAYLKKKKLFRKDKDARLYDEGPYYFSQLITTLPLDLFLCAAVVVIYFFVLGLNDYPHLITNMLLQFFFIFVGCYISGQSISGILASIGDTIETISPLVPLILSPLMISAGYMANLKTATFPIRWIAYISPIRFVYQGFTLTEFQNRSEYIESCFTWVEDSEGRHHVKIPDESKALCDPNQVLDFYQMNILTNIYYLVGLVVLFRILGYVIFKIKATQGRMQYRANQTLRLKFDYRGMKEKEERKNTSYIDPLANIDSL